MCRCETAAVVASAGPGVTEQRPSLPRCQKQTNPSLGLDLLAQDLHPDLGLDRFPSLGPEADLSLVQGSAG